MKVCIVDDDPIFQFVTRRLIELTFLDSTVIPFANGSFFKEHLESNLNSMHKLSDFIFVDINMPLMNGWQLLDALHNMKLANYKPEIYIVSSSVDDQDIQKAMSYTLVKGYLSKPLSKEILKSIFNSRSPHVSTHP